MQNATYGYSFFNDPSNETLTDHNIREYILNTIYADDRLALEYFGPSQDKPNVMCLVFDLEKFGRLIICNSFRRNPRDIQIQALKSDCGAFIMAKECFANLL